MNLTADKKVVLKEAYRVLKVRKPFMMMWVVWGPNFMYRTPDQAVQIEALAGFILLGRFLLHCLSPPLSIKLDT